MKKFVEDHLDVLQNIEFGIVEVSKADPSLLDMDVKEAIDALVRHYHAEEVQRTPPVMALSVRAERVFLTVQEFCEWRLGRSALRRVNAPPEVPTPIDVMVKGLREIQKSIPRWTKTLGRKGYLGFISKFIV